MQRIHLIGANDIVALSGGTAHVVLPEYLDKHLLCRFYRERSERGDAVVYVSRAPFVKVGLIKKVLPKFHVTKVVLFASALESSPSISNIRMLDAINCLQDNGYEPVVVVPGKQAELNYDYLTHVLPEGVAIGFSNEVSKTGNGYGRYLTIRKLVESRNLRLNRDYYLFELENPAELSVYGSGFTPMIRRLFTGFISARCYIDSLYGIEYSPSVGLFHHPIPADDLENTCYIHTQQTAQFFMNDDMMKSYSMGRLGDGIHALYERAVKGATDV